MNKSHFDIIIIGAGAAGLMCAQLTAALKKQKILIVDHSHKLAQKIRISGGGRCNFTNLYTKAECYISQNMHFAKSALSRYTPTHFCELLNKHNITYHEKTLGQLFCNDSSQLIIDLLDFLCRQNLVQRQMATEIFNITRINKQFFLTTNHGIISCDKLVIATGGLAIPQIGATGFGYTIAQQFNLAIVPTAPALVGLQLNQQDLNLTKPLAGISFNAETKIGKITFKEQCLFTHRGLNGPAILQISSYWQNNQTILLNLLPEHDITTLLYANRQTNKLLSNFLSEYFSIRLAKSLITLLGFDKALSQLTKAQIQQTHNLLHNFSIIPSATEGYRKAEVTRGGVDTRCLNSKSMMAKEIEGLYFIGEVVDVTGWLGGYNFQWAWSSAYAAAQSLAI